MSVLINDFTEILETRLFPKINTRNVILLLGAGASVTSTHTFLSWQIIKEYSQHLGIDAGTNNIIEFVDFLSADERYSRRDFDSFVQNMLEKLEPAEAHKIIASLAWKEIITTNLDLVVEKAFDRIKNTPLESYKIKPIREVKEESFVASNDEIRYVKLHGCISSREKYPFIFSTADFERANTFYKRVLSRVTYLSTDIDLLAIGYSFSDDFAKKLLDNFDKYARAGRRPMYLVDPFINDVQVPYFKEKGIDIIKMGAVEFFDRFQKWQSEQDEDTARRKKHAFYDVAEHRINPPAYILRNLGNDLKPLSSSHKQHYIKPENFYRGDEPSFDVISQELDVVRTNLLVKALDKIETVLNDVKVFVPIILLKGNFGIGKSTFLYRLIEESVKRSEWQAIAFEVGDPQKVSIKSLEELFAQTKAKTVFLVLERIETGSSYRAFRQFQSQLSMGQFTQFKVVLLSSIRDNILEKFKINSALQDSVEIDLNEPLTVQETENLIRKLESHNLISCRDANERREVVTKVLKQYDGDLLVSLSSLISESNHDRILQDAIKQLSDVAQKALLFIALFYQHQIKVPVGLLRILIGLEWLQFGEQVLRVDFKGFVLQETIERTGLESDVYLRIRHRRIAEIIVRMFYPTEDSLFSIYRDIINKLEVNYASSIVITDLLKAIRQQKELTQAKIDKLFDAAAQNFYKDSHFVLHYTMNLERRGTIKDLQKGIDEIIYITSELNDLHNDRLIHRRAVLTAQLGKLIYKENREAYQAISFFNTAREYFERKLILDPQSHYSYENYLKFEIWCLDKLVYSSDDELRQRIRIEELFEQAENLVKTNINRIQEIKVHYHRKIYGQIKNEKDYLKFLEDNYNDKSLRPLSLVLQYYYYYEKGNSAKYEMIIRELEMLVEYDSVVMVLFHYYGTRLHNPNIRQKFLEFSRKHPEIESRQPIRYHFFQSITQAYNKHFSDAYEHIRNLTERFSHFSSDLNDTWKDSIKGESEIFEAMVLRKRGRYYAKIIDLQQRFPLKISSINNELKSNDLCWVELQFNPYGIRAILKDVVKPDM